MRRERFAGDTTAARTAGPPFLSLRAGLEDGDPSGLLSHYEQAVEPRIEREGRIGELRCPKSLEIYSPNSLNATMLHEVGLYRRPCQQKSYIFY